MTLFAADAWTGTLVELPWIERVENGNPVAVEARVSGTVSSNEDSDVVLSQVELRPGWTTTEEWTLTRGEEDWEVVGSRSGKQSRRVVRLLPYSTDNGALSFVLSGTGANPGDTLTLRTDTGVVEHDLGGFIQDLAWLPGVERMVAAVFDRDLVEASLVVFDPASQSVEGKVVLVPGAVPHRFATDESGLRVFVADAVLPIIHEVVFQADLPESYTLRTLPIPGVASELAWQQGEDYEHLFFALAGENRVDILDLDTETLVDLNPATEAIDGLSLDAPVMGMASSLGSRILPETSSWGGYLEGETVAVSSFAGELWLLHGSTGCPVQSEIGPYAYQDGDRPFVDSGPASNPVMDEENQVVVSVQLSQCAAQVKSESWVAIYDESAGYWVVEGSRSGLQDSPAYEDIRYVSDEGTVSFLIRGGSLPSSEGDQFRWHTVSGLAVANGDLNGNGEIEVNLEYPGRPVAWSWQDQDPPWVEAQPESGFLWPATNGDVVMLVDDGDASAKAVVD